MISGILAYKINEAELVWSENSWNFHYVGMPVNQDKKEMLSDLASTWSDIEISNFELGKVEIVEGNKLTINYDWVKDDYQYSYITKGTEFEDDLKIINSFTKID